MSDLVENPEDRFSGVAAQIKGAMMMREKGSSGSLTRSDTNNHRRRLEA